MSKRDRVRARSQRAARDTAAAERPSAVLAQRERPERARARHRGAPPPPGGARAIGVPSPTLERAAAAERTYVVKDFRRLAVVVGLVLLLLAASGVAVSALFK